MFDLKVTFVVSLVLFVMISKAEKFNNTEVLGGKKAEINEDNSAVTSAKGLRFFPFFGAPALLGLGGLHALTILYAIKVKIIFVVFVIALSMYFYSKIYLNSCGQKEIIHETNPYESYGPSGYSNSLPAGIGYPGTDRFNSLSIASFDHDHHTIDHDPNLGITETKPLALTDNTEVMRGVYNQMRQFTNPIFDIDWLDMAFQLLGIDSDECRRRFTCEFDFRVKQIPYSSYIFNLDSPVFLNRYRESSPDVNHPTTFSDCALFYGECTNTYL